MCWAGPAGFSHRAVTGVREERVGWEGTWEHVLLLSSPVAVMSVCAEAWEHVLLLSSPVAVMSVCAEAAGF